MSYYFRCQTCGDLCTNIPSFDANDERPAMCVDCFDIWTGLGPIEYRPLRGSAQAMVDAFAWKNRVDDLDMRATMSEDES